jgi:hypothetical protein
MLTANSLSNDYGETMTESNQNSQTDICSTVAGGDSESCTEVSMEDETMENIRYLN